MDRCFSLLFGSEAIEEVLNGEVIDLVKALGSATTAKLFLFKDDGILYSISFLLLVIVLKVK